MDETVDAMDLISELPTFILHHIMSYLHPGQVARTSVLSKRWNQLRISFPILEFCNGFCEWRQGSQEFIKLVDTSLLRFLQLKLVIQKLTLHLELLNDKGLSSQLVDKWIGLAVENGVKEFYFVVRKDDINGYTVPQTIFSAKSLTTLNLACCQIELPWNSISLNSLKKLILRRIYMNEQMIDRLICECCLLEDLYLSACSGFKYLTVSKAHKLRIMTIEDCQSSELERVVVPSLQQLTLRKIIVVAHLLCPNLKKLILHGVVLKDQEFHCLILKFPLLEDLSVMKCFFIERIKISSGLLKHLLFEFCKNMKAVDLDTPNLLSFTYGSIQIPMVSMKTSQLCPWKVHFALTGDIDHWYLKLKEFLAASSQIKKIAIALYKDLCKMPFSSNKFRKHSYSFPVQVGDMTLRMKVPIQEYRTFSDGLFSICYPKTLRLPTISEASPSFIEWLFEQLKNRNVKCCGICPIKCWRHYLKDIKTVKFSSNGDDWPININNWRGSLPIFPSVYHRHPDAHFTLSLEWRFPELNDKS